ncbi:MAG: TonB-dependent receptor, partial [Ramlibacter sp.]|nr:TonB-dependent receptor [Ramlibacter sp.]
TAAYRATPEWSFFARVENLFDRDYQTIYGYQQAGRRVFAGVTWQPR